MPDTHSPSVPRLKTPVEHAPVDGTAVFFAWEAVPGALDYRLQVAGDDAFQKLLCVIETGETTVLTLYELLPEDDSVYYWRVQAKTPTGWQDWSPPASFKASTAQKAKAYQEQQLPSVEVGRMTRSADPEANAPYRVSYTSQRASALFFSIMLVSFVVLLLLLQARSLARLNTPDDQVMHAEDNSPLPTSYQMVDSTSRTYQIPIDSAMQAVVRDANSSPPAASGWRLPN